MLGAVHKPGAIALRPLGLGDIYDAAFRIIRFNPQATVGSAVLVTSVAMLVPVVVTTILAWSVDLTLDLGGDPALSEMSGVLAVLGSVGIGVLLQSIGLILVTGMVAHVTLAAALGKRLTLAQAWAATAGKRWRLIGLVLLLGLLLMLVVTAFAVLWAVGAVALDPGPAVLLFVVSLPVAAIVLCWFWIRVYYLPVPALMLEPVGILGALSRGYTLTRRAFWRVFGIGLLTMLIAGIAGSMLATPITLVLQALLGAGVPSQFELVTVTVVNAVGAVVQAAFVAPFTAAVTSLQYVDQRIRKEAFDVELMTRAGITVL